MDTRPAARTGPHWRVPAADGPVRAVVTLPGSKSMTNRALVLAALADGPSVVANPLPARDTLLMAGTGADGRTEGGHGARHEQRVPGR